MLILKNAIYIDWKNLDFKKCNILVKEGAQEDVLYIDDNEVLNYDAKVVNCSGKYVTKSFSCAHHQSYMALSTGMPGLNKMSGNLYNDLKNIW